MTTLRPGEQPEEFAEETSPAFIEQAQRQYSDEIRSLSLGQGGERSRNAETQLHYLLNALLDRAERDPEVIDLLSRFLGKLGSRAAHRESTDPIPNKALEDIRSVLIGATMAIEADRDTGRADMQPKNHMKDVRHFIELISSRVGRMDDAGNKTTLRMRTLENQAGDNITFTKTPPATA